MRFRGLEVRRVLAVIACALLPTVGTEAALAAELSHAAVAPFRGDLNALFPPTTTLLAPAAVKEGAAAVTTAAGPPAPAAEATTPAAGGS